MANLKLSKSSSKVGSTVRARVVNNDLDLESNNSVRKL
jgi:hypothetical protein